MGTLKRILSGLLIVLFLGGSQAALAQGVVATEYAVKAAFLYNFAKFIEWPPGIGGPRPGTVILCVVGEDPFGFALDELAARGVEGLAEGIPVHIKHVEGLGAAEGCHIAFLSNSERSRLGGHLANATANHVVTVSDLDGFARGGGMIQFVLEDGRVRFWINRAAAERAGVTLSSRLLSLARLVEEPR